MIKKTDEQLVADYLAGDSQAFELLVSIYLKPIYSFIVHYIGSPTDAEDITQDVFLRVWRHLKKFDQEKRFKTWLFGIAKNASFDWLKKKKSIPFSNFENEAGENILANTLIDPSPLPDELFNNADLADKLNKAILQLPPNYCSVLLLYYHEQFNLREIAESLGEPVDTIKSRHRRALILLRQLITE